MFRENHRNETAESERDRNKLSGSIRLVDQKSGEDLDRKTRLRERRDVGGGDDATGGRFNKKRRRRRGRKKMQRAASSSGDTKNMSKSKVKMHTILSSMSKTTKSTNQERTTIPNLGLVTD